jgi:diguanylate cyclase (GGDEF)-like protein
VNYATASPTNLFRDLFKRLGLVKSVLLTTAFSVLLSITITATITTIVYGDFGVAALAIAIIVPSVLAPTFGYFTLKVLFQLYKTEDRLHVLATTDDLTGVFNRRYFLKLAQEQIERVILGAPVFSIILFDVDNFKQVNDTYGHSAGDQALRCLTKTFQNSIRKTDILARFGGEEFIILLPNTNPREATELAERIRLLLESTLVPFNGAEIGLTISAGVAGARPETLDLDDLLLNADIALYKAKDLGKNCTVVS